MKEDFLEFVRLMSLPEWVGFAVVAIGTVVLWGAFARLLFRRLLARWLGREIADRPSRRVRLTIYALCAIYAALFAYARFVEPERLVLKRLTLTSDKVPAGQVLRLAHVTDLHAQGRYAHRLERTAEAVKALNPDLVLLTGDYLCDYRRGAPTALLGFLLRLPDVPTVAVPGNYGGRLPADPLFEQLGIEMLHTETRLFEVAGVPIELLGDSPRRRADAVRPRQAPERLGIFLQHFPALLPQAAEAGWDLFLAGHTHGGQVRLPWYGAIITLDAAGKEFELGAYRLGDTVGMVSAGVGMECRGAPQVRFLCPPEIVLLEITGTGPPAR